MALKFDDEDEDGDIVAEINMTPLIDIMLVLLIIFMVSSSISLDSGIDIELPDSKSKTTAKESESILITVNGMSEIFIKGERVELSMLGESLKKNLANVKDKMVILEGDKKLPLGFTVEIMDIAKNSGATGFAILADDN